MGNGVSFKQQRADEADRKADINKGWEQAEKGMLFLTNGLEGATFFTWEMEKGARDRLQKQNQKLAADVGEEPMLCADTEDSDALVEQIKGLKGENDRLREMQQSNRSKRNRRKKKKADGFGQQQE